MRYALSMACISMGFGFPVLVISEQLKIRGR
jgi:hypothetical protein